MSQVSDPKLAKLAAKVLEGPRRDPGPLWRSLLGRWSEYRYRRALASAPVEALSVALTDERNRREASPVA